MADSRRLFSILILLFSLANTVTAIPLHELESMINALRATSYNLFDNAIITSDINYEILSRNSFTVFAPTDSSLFTLDMTASASEYINALHCHVVPRRFSLSELRMFPTGASLHSLDPTHEVILERRRSLVNEVITVDGVSIVVPDLFYGRDIVVHRLGGIITSRSEIGSGQQSPSNMTNMTGDNASNATVFQLQVNLHVASTRQVQLRGNISVSLFSCHDYLNVIEDTKQLEFPMLMNFDTNLSRQVQEMIILVFVKFQKILAAIYINSVFVKSNKSDLVFSLVGKENISVAHKVFDELSASVSAYSPLYFLQIDRQMVVLLKKLKFWNHVKFKMKDKNGFCCDDMHLIDANFQFTLLDQFLSIMVQSQSNYSAKVRDITSLVICLFGMSKCMQH